MRARYVSVGGLRTRILEGGSGGVPLFLLHAVGLTADTWIRNIDALAERRLVIAPDMPGHGFTDAFPGYTDAPQLFWARHLLALADALGFDRFHVAGSSFSGLVAVLIALAAPERTESLTVVGSGTVFHEADGRERALRAAFANGSRAITEASIEACRTRLQGICHAADSVDERILLAQASAYAQPDRLVAYKQVIEGAIASGREAQALHRLEAIDAPTLIITGRQDVRASVASHVAGAARIPGALLHVYDACGHLPYLEHSDRFNKDLGGFLEALKTQPTKDPVHA